MTSLAGRIGKATATTMLAGAMGGVALLAGEAIAAKGRRYAKPTMGLALRTSMGPAGAPTLRLVLLGDAAAIGVGVEWLSETVGGQLARMLAEGTLQSGERHVLLSSVGAAVRRLRDAGVQVVVGTCPDLGAVRSVAPPLRQLAGWLGRRMARAQTE